MEGQDSGETTDPVFQNHPSKSMRDPINRNSIEHLPSRPAKDLLEDCMNRLMTLEWIPAGYHNSQKEDPEACFFILKI